MVATSMLTSSDLKASTREISLRDRQVWQEAALLWLGTRLLFAALTYLMEAFLLLGHTANTVQTLGWDDLFRPWLGWDGAQYARIARDGYVQHWQTAFFPLLPLLEHIGAMDLLHNAAATGVVGAIIANLCALASFALLRVLVERELGREVARRTVFYLAIFPTAFFLAAAYTEALFLLLSLGAFLCLRRGRWLSAGLLAALATLTRPVGILLLVPLVVEYVFVFRRWRATHERPALLDLGRMVAGGMLPLLALGGFSVYEKLHFGSFDATASAQANGGGRAFTLPIVGFARVGAALIHNGPLVNYNQAHILVDSAFTLLFIVLAILTWRRLPLAYVLYTWAMVLLVLATPSHNAYALSSNMRYMLVVFPLFLLLGQWGADRRIERIILCLSLPLLALFTVTFLHSWLA